MTADCRQFKKDNKGTNVHIHVIMPADREFRALVSCMSLIPPVTQIIITKMRQRVTHDNLHIASKLQRDAFEKSDSIEERDKKAKQIIESLGGKMISLYYTFGQYDFVVIIDMPSKENLVKFLSIVAKHGTVRTETLETIPADMFYKIAKEV